MNFLSNKLDGYIQEQRSSLTPPYPVRYIELLKTLVESDFGPKPSRQKLVIEIIIQIQKNSP